MGRQTCELWADKEQNWFVLSGTWLVSAWGQGKMKYFQFHTKKYLINITDVVGLNLTKCCVALNCVNLWPCFICWWWILEENQPDCVSWSICFESFLCVALQNAAVLIWSLLAFIVKNCNHRFWKTQFLWSVDYTHFVACCKVSWFVHARGRV